MKIVTARRISQIFFFLLFLWFCIVTTLGERWWQLRGWPVGWLIQLDPLVGLGTLLATGTLYAGLLWGLATVILTILLGRFFCGWLCPFGALHQAVGWIANRGRKASAMIAANRYRRGQRIKYLILFFLLGAAAGDLLGWLLKASMASPALLAAVLAGALLLGVAVARWRNQSGKRWAAAVVLVAIGWMVLGFLADGSRLLAASLQTGLLDPIPLFYRSVNLALLPLVDGRLISLSPAGRLYPGVLAIGVIFWAAVFLNLRIPRFYCRFVCPLGALFGLLGKNALWRVGQKADGCTACGACDRYCEGACEPSSVIRTPECVMCMNCLAQCRHDVMGYQRSPSAAGEIAVPDIARREFVLTLAAGAAAVPLARLAGMTGDAWNPDVIRPPGALPETAFLQRCIKCGQCMRVCPTNVIHPALQAGSKASGPRCSTSAWGPAAVSGVHRLRQPVPHRRHPPITGRALGPRRFDPGAPSASARPLSTGAAACPGPWTAPASSARKTVRSAPRRSSPARPTSRFGWRRAGLRVWRTTGASRVRHCRPNGLQPGTILSP